MGGPPQRVGLDRRPLRLGACSQPPHAGPPPDSAGARSDRRRAVSVRLSEDEAWDLLGSSHTGILTSLRRGGVPVSLPVWFVVDDRSVLVAGPARSHKFTRIRRDGRIAFLVESGEAWKDLRACAPHRPGRRRRATRLGVDRRGVRGEVCRVQTPREKMPAATAGPLRRRPIVGAAYRDRTASDVGQPATGPTLSVVAGLKEIRTRVS